MQAILNANISARNPNRKNAHKGGSGPLISTTKSFALQTGQPHYVLDFQKLTNTPVQSLNTTGQKLKTMATSLKSTGLKFPTLTCLREGVLAKICRLQANELVWGENVPVSSTNLCERCKRKNQNILYGKTLKELCLLTKEETSPSFSMKWPKQGILSGGKFSTPKISVCLKTENVSLSSVLETEVPEKYFLSENASMRVMEHWDYKVFDNVQEA